MCKSDSPRQVDLRCGSGWPTADGRCPAWQDGLPGDCAILVKSCTAGDPCELHDQFFSTIILPLAHAYEAAMGIRPAAVTRVLAMIADRRRDCFDAPYHKDLSIDEKRKRVAGATALYSLELAVEAEWPVQA